MPTPPAMISPTVISLDELMSLRATWEQDGQRVALVPTMGALHAGHLSLVQRARELADKVLVSIFVNPAQFGPNEDFERYPRTLQEDLEKLASASVDAVFLPSTALMYPSGFQTYVHNKSMALDLCGASRKGHFEGVLTVVLKLFNQTRAHYGIFGKKDYQQFRLIERMVRDLNLPIEIVGVETLRESDGLAMSSRNRYLSPADRQTATVLSQALLAAQKLAVGGKAESKSVEKVLQAFHQQVVSASDLKLEYVELRRQDDLTAFESHIDAPAVLLTAARLGSTRLIDNMEITL